MENKYLWSKTIDDIVRGYSEDDNKYSCNFCEAEFIKGNIYEFDNNLCDSYGAIKNHIILKHISVTDYMLNMKHSNLGISEIQLNILKMIAMGKNDREIAGVIGVTQSTIRNHRFKLREKEKQAKLYLALMESIRTNTRVAINETDNGSIEEVHNSATMIDERYNITNTDTVKVLNTYMNENGALTQFPPKAKKKIILLREIIKNFKTNVEYSENEVNRILKRIYHDYPTIRRSLIEYGFMDRTDDCSIYRVKE